VAAGRVCRTRAMPSKNARRAGKVSVKAKPKTPYHAPALKGIEKLGWDKKSTPAQNYKRLGLVVDPNKEELRPDPVGVPRPVAPIEALVPEARPHKFSPLAFSVMNEIRPLIRKYGDDCAKMARDHKLNQWQRTQEQLIKLVAHFHETEAHAAAKVASE